MLKTEITNLIKKIRNEIKNRGNTRGRVADVLDGLNDYKADLVDGKVPLEQLPEFPDTGIKSVREGQNITIDNTDPLNPVVSAQLPEIPDQGIRTIQEGLNIKVDNTDPLNPVVSAQVSSFEGIETADSSTVTFTGDGTEDNPLGATLSVVSATQSGIVDNTHLQELGGVDKLINTVRVGRGNLNKGNVVVGTSDSLDMNTTGRNNTAIGISTLSNNTTGSFNTAIGGFALWKNTTGVWNCAFGETLIYNTTGTRNVGVGSSLYQNKTGSHNTGVGFNAGYAIESGNHNTYIGRSAGYDNGIGHYNVAIGALSMIIVGAGYSGGGSTVNMNNNVFIGSSLRGNSTMSNILAIDNKGATITDAANALIYGGFSDANRFLNIGGKFSITPTHIPTADNTYTKNIVAKPDGTFGWEDKQSSSTTPNLQQVTTAGNVTTVDEIKMGYIDNKTRLFSFPNGSVGFGGLPKTATGGLNTVMGDWTGVSLTTGEGNSLIGANSGSNLTTGSYNTLMGFDFYANLTTGSYNTFLGNMISSPSNATRSVVVGTGAVKGSYGTVVGSGKAGINSIGIGYTNTDTNVNSVGDYNILMGYDTSDGYWFPSSPGIGRTKFNNVIGIGNYIGAYGTFSGSYPGQTNPNTFKKDNEFILNSYVSTSDFSEPLLRGDFTPGAKYLKVADKLGVNFAFTETLNSNFNVKGSESSTITTINSATTLDAHRYIIANGSNYLITLPAANTCKGRKYTIKTIGTGITISSFKNISNVDTTTLAQNTSITLISDGTVWQEF